MPGLFGTCGTQARASNDILVALGATLKLRTQGGTTL